MEEITNPVVDWGVAALSLAGEEHSGDAHVVKAWGKNVLAAVIDGLGHGGQAAVAAGTAAATLSNHASNGADVVSLVRLCHESLARTRGAVLSVALFDAANDAMTWLGVGNVDGLLLRADSQAKRPRESLLLRGGVVGYQLPSLHSTSTNVNRGDILIFSTDGIRGGFESDVNRQESPQQIADKIIMNHNRKTDDALVLVARYTGGAS